MPRCGRRRRLWYRSRALMIDSVRRLAVGAFGLAIAVSCATGVADDVAVAPMPSMGGAEPEPCRGPPGAVETCKGEDDNCDGRIDEGFDLDGDHWVSCTVGNKP